MHQLYPICVLCTGWEFESMFEAKARQQQGAVLLTNCPILRIGAGLQKIEFAESFILQSSSLATAYSDRADMGGAVHCKTNGKK